MPPTKPTLKQPNVGKILRASALYEELNIVLFNAYNMWLQKYDAYTDYSFKPVNRCIVADPQDPEDHVGGTSSQKSKNGKSVF